MHVATKRKTANEQQGKSAVDLTEFVPGELGSLGNSQTAIPRLAKDEQAVRMIEQAVQTIPTSHRLYMGDAREIASIEPESVHLVLTWIHDWIHFQCLTAEPKSH